MEPSKENSESAYNHIKDMIIKRAETLKNVYSIESFEFTSTPLTTIPSEIGLLSSLSKLDLSKNQLNHLPIELTKLKTLQGLYLRENCIEVISDEVISGLTTIKMLDIGQNKLSELPESIGKLSSLTHFWADGNKLTSLPSSITQLKNLSHIYIFSNKLKDLPRDIHTFSKLLVLDAQDNEISSDLENLHKLTLLRDLNLTNNKLKNIPHNIWLMSDLQFLRLLENPIENAPGKLLYKRARVIKDYMRLMHEGKDAEANDLLEHSMNAPIRQKSIGAREQVAFPNVARVSRKFSSNTLGKHINSNDNSESTTKNNPKSLKPTNSQLAIEIPSGIVKNASQALQRRASQLDAGPPIPVKKRAESTPKKFLPPKKSVGKFGKLPPKSPLKKLPSISETSSRNEITSNVKRPESSNEERYEVVNNQEANEIVQDVKHVIDNEKMDVIGNDDNVVDIVKEAKPENENSSLKEVNDSHSVVQPQELETQKISDAQEENEVLQKPSEEDDNKEVLQELPADEEKEILEKPNEVAKVVTEKVIEKVQETTEETKVKKKKKSSNKSSKNTESAPPAKPKPLVKIFSKSYLLEQDELDEFDISTPQNLSREYKNSFYGNEHINFIAQDEVDGGYLVVSLLPIANKDTEINCLVRNKAGDFGLLIPIPDVRPKNPNQWRRLLRNEPEFNKIVNEDIKLFYVDDSSFPDEYLELESKLCRDKFKVGVVFCDTDQITQEEMLSNDEGNKDFENFLQLLGKKITLKNWDGYDGGLDVTNNETGKYSIFTKYKSCSIMFHVSTLLPPCNGDEEKITEKKVHIGNDIVVIIFMGGESTFNPKKFISHFNHVFIIVKPETVNNKAMYRVNIIYKNGIQPAIPSMPANSLFEQTEHFRDLLLSKIINSEISACESSEQLSQSFNTLRYHLLNNIFTKFRPKPKKGCFLCT